jgi:hypothetical protein
VKTSRVLAGIVVVTLALAGRSQAAQPDSYFPSLYWNGRAVVLPTATFRNGDWFSLGAVGIVTLSPQTCGRYLAATSRAEAGVGGAAAAIGLATNIGDAPCELNNALTGSGLLSLEARVARTYGLTSWHRTDYAGAQVSLAVFAVGRLTLGLMVDVHDHQARHTQLGYGVLF